MSDERRGTRGEPLAHHSSNIARHSSSLRLRWGPIVSDREILAARPAKNPVDPSRPAAFFVEPERTAEGRVEDVATVFLTNRECPFRCLMCDLWKNTTDDRVPVGAIPRQIDFALSRLPPALHVKLYNSGNFFDAQAIPRADYEPIAERLRRFRTVIVENHPKLCNQECVRFRDLLGANADRPPRLEIAIGLETVHPEVLRRLNKQMTLDDFDRAVSFLVGHDIAARVFILLKPPFMTEQEGIEWALRSIERAFAVGVECCAVIPTRGGNGIMEHLQARGQFTPPQLSSLEAVLDAGIRLGKGRVFVDLWDVERFFACPQCGPLRAERMRRMNLLQQILPRIECACDRTPR